MATLLLRRSRSSKMLQAASSLAMPLDPPGNQAAAKDKHVHGSAGRQQVTTLPLASSVEPPFATSSAPMIVVGTSRQT